MIRFEDTDGDAAIYTIHKSLFRQTKSANNQECNHNGEEEQIGVVKLANRISKEIHYCITRCFSTTMYPGAVSVKNIEPVSKGKNKKLFRRNVSLLVPITTELIRAN
jgi:hypothetical protein